MGRRFPSVEPGTSLAERRLRAVERIASVLSWTVAIVAISFVVWMLGDVLLLIFAAALLALGLRGLADLLGRASGLGSGTSLAAAVAALLVLLALAAWWAGPRLVSEASQLQAQLPRQMGALRSWLDSTWWGSGLLDRIPRDLGASAPDSGGLAPRVSGMVMGAFWSTIGLLGTAVLVTAAALYFAASPGSYLEGPLRLVPPSRHQGARATAESVGKALQAWLAGQLVDMFVVGVVTSVGLFLLGVPLPFILGLIAALLNFVPYVGAIAGAVPAMLIAISQGPEQVLFVAILFIVVQTLEGNVLSPLIQRRAVNLPPAATLFSQVTLGALFGLPGVVLATPVAAAVLAAFRELISKPA